MGEYQQIPADSSYDVFVRKKVLMFVHPQCFGHALYFHRNPHLERKFSKDLGLSSFLQTTPSLFCCSISRIREEKVSM